jgi:hypothetical protein
MKRKSAVASFWGVCMILAFLLLLKIITSTVSGLIFAIALVLFGGLSRGFRGEDATSNVNKENVA